MFFFIEDFQNSVNINRRKRARRFTLRVCQVTGNISLTIPLRSSISAAKKFLKDNQNWVNEQLNQVIPKAYMSIGTRVPVEGIEREICLKKHHQEGHSLEERKLLLDCTESEVGVMTKEFLFGHAVDVLVPIIKQNAEHVIKKIKAVRFKDTKSRWGSCSSEGSLMINWRLIMAPPSVYRYVVVHEVSHLEYMNHGAEFWKLVKTLHPSYLEDRAWLRNHGRKLKSFVFETFNYS